MVRSLPYLALFAAVTLLQVFLFDNLSISIYCDPLVYVAFVALLPIDAKPVVVLLAGLAMGVAMDCTMGAAGVNTIATLLIAFLRPTLLGLFLGRDDAREGGVPSPERLGRRVFLEYLAAIVLIHHAVFFALEALSWTHAPHTLLRVAMSNVVSVLFIWFIARIFTAKRSVRL